MGVPVTGTTAGRMGRLSDRAEEILGRRLEPDEHVWVAVPASFGSLLLYGMCCLLAVSILVYSSSTPPYWPGFAAFIVVFGACIYLGQRFAMKPRVLALTDRRLFVCEPTSWFRDRFDRVAAEARRDTVRLSWISKDRLILSGDGVPALKARVPRWSAERLREWVDTGSAKAT